MLENSTFRTASSTKTFTAAATLRLWEQGRVALDDRLDAFLPGELIERLNIVDKRSYGSQIAIRHLLQHTCGIREPDNEEYLEVVFQDPKKRWTPIEQIELAIEGGAPYNRPGTEARYSNTGYIILAIIIEQASELPLAQAFRSLLRFDGLGLDSIHLETLEAVPPAAGLRVRQYLGDQDVTDLDASIDLFGGGGLVSNARDLAGFWRALFEGRVFDSSATLDEMCRTVPGPEEGVEFGLGVFKEDVGSSWVWSHTGFWGSFAVHDPDSGMTIAGATNQAASRVPKGAVSKLYSNLVEIARGG